MSLRGLLSALPLALASAGALGDAPANPPPAAAATRAPRLPPGIKLPPGVQLPPGYPTTALANGGAQPPSSDGPQPPPDLKAELVAPFNVSLRFFQSLANHDAASMAGTARIPFYFEGKSVGGLEEIRKRWAAALDDLGRAPLVLYGLEVLPYDEMVKRYGKPPARLGDVPFKGSVIAVGNINGRAEVAALRKDASGMWQVFAFHD